MNHLETIEYFLTLEKGTLVLDMETKELETSGSTEIKLYGSYLKIGEILKNEDCDCGYYYDDECEKCNKKAKYYLNIVKGLLK